MIGLCFLINAQNFSFHIDFGPMLLALLCLLIGIKLIFPNKNKRKGKHIHVNIHSGSDREHDWREEEQATTESGAETYQEFHTNAGKSDGYVNISAVLGGKEVRMDNEVFTGADISAVLGGAELNLRNAIINEDVFINVTAVMGGAEIYLPANVKVVTDNCTAVLGGVDVSRAYANIPALDAPKVIISGSCVMGGIDVH